MDKPILMRSFKVALYNLMMCKEDNPGSKYFKGDHFKNKDSAGQMYSFVIYF